MKNTARVTDANQTAFETTLHQNAEPKVATETQATVTAKAKPLFDTQTLQTTIDTWSAETPGDKAVVAMTPEGEVLASINPDNTFFAASLYKLYAAYFGYQDIDVGKVNSAEDYNGGRTRSECLDVMVKESDSPCAEQLLSELGKAEVMSRLQAIGITNTSMGSLSTTAKDAATLLAIIARGEGLTPASHSTLLKSMHDQIFRDALVNGFSDELAVYEKVGFNELMEYHDVAIVELKDGRKFILAVLTEGVGTRNIAELARRVEAILQ